ncbi:MAG: hypothetical protein AAFQ24_14085 [Pseudomonadota bacterium]
MDWPKPMNLYTLEKTQDGNSGIFDDLIDTMQKLVNCSQAD